MYIRRNTEKGTNELSKSFVKGIYSTKMCTQKIYTRTHHAVVLDTYL